MYDNISTNQIFAADFTTGDLAGVIEALRNLDLYISAYDNEKPRMLAVITGEGNDTYQNWIDLESYVPKEHTNYTVNVYYSGAEINEIKCSDGEWRVVELANLLAPFALDLDTVFVNVLNKGPNYGITVVSYNVSDGAITNEEVVISGIVDNGDPSGGEGYGV